MAKREIVESGSAMPARLPYHSFKVRAVYSLLLIMGVLLIGTIGFHVIEGYSYVEAFYFTSMLATAQGPANTPVTTVGKLFASAIAFISVGAVIVAFGFLFGPFFGKVLRMEERKLEKDERRIATDLRKYGKKL